MYFQDLDVSITEWKCTYYGLAFLFIVPYHDILHYLPYLCEQRLCRQEIDLNRGKYDSTHYHSVSKSMTHGDQITQK